MSHNRRLLNYSLFTTIIATVLAAAAPLAATFVDGICAGNLLGKAAFNAINIVLPVSNLVAVFNLIFNLGGSVLAARAIAEGDDEKGRKLFTLCIIMSAAISAICILFMAIRLDDVASFLCPEPDEMPYVKQYLQILLLYYACLPAVGALNNFVSIEGHPTLTTRIILIANAVNIALDLLFMAVLDMGIKGAAWATVASGALNIALFIPHFIKGQSRYHFVKLYKKDWSLLRGMLIQGLGLNIFYIMTNLLVFFSNNLVLNKLGTDIMLIYGVCLQVQSITFCIAYGVCIAGIGQITVFKGDGDNESIRFVTNKILKITCISYSIILLVMSLFPGSMASIFGIHDPEVLSSCRPIFICYFIYYLCFGIIAVYSTICLQLSGYVLAKAVYVLGLGILVYILMSVISAFNPEMMWLGFPVGGIIALIATLSFGFRRHLKDKSLTLFTLASKLPSDVRVSVSVNYDGKDIPQMIDSLNLFSEICEISQKNKDNIELCCLELCDNVRERRLPLLAKTFDLTFRQKEDRFLMTIKAPGGPVCVKVDESTINEWRRKPADLTPEEIRYILLNTIPEELTYRYMFGMNVTTLSWKI